MHAKQRKVSVQHFDNVAQDTELSNCSSHRIEKGVFVLFSGNLIISYKVFPFKYYVFLKKWIQN